MATEKNISSRIIHKHDIEANWNKATNFTPKQGELIIYDIDATHDYERLKIGDGVTLVSDLPFVDDHLSDAIDKIASGSTVVEKANEATHATSADNATSADKASTADSATKATQDGSGNVITDTYETKVDAAQKLIDAKSYADTAVETAIADKAEKEHTHDDIYYTETEVDEKISAINTSIDRKYKAINKKISNLSKTITEQDIDTAFNDIFGGE